MALFTGAFFVAQVMLHAMVTNTSAPKMMINPLI